MGKQTAFCGRTTSAARSRAPSLLIPDTHSSHETPPISTPTSFSSESPMGKQTAFCGRTTSAGRHSLEEPSLVELSEFLQSRSGGKSPVQAREIVVDVSKFCCIESATPPFLCFLHWTLPPSVAIVIPVSFSLFIAFFVSAAIS